MRGVILVIIINSDLLDLFLAPITGLGDDNESVEYYRKLKIQDKNDYKKIINEIIVEEFEELNEQQKLNAKLVLSYYLTSNAIDFERVFESVLPPFDPPYPVRNFFLWIWECIFLNESYEFTEEYYKIIK